VIDYVTGSLGMGKSAYVVREMAQSFITGRAVAGNVRLVDEWAELVAKHNPWLLRGARRGLMAAAVRDLESRYHYADTLEELTWVNLHGKGEKRGVLVLDEAHNELNNRDWQSVESREFLRWVSLLRKLGWRARMISQHADNTDAGARRICQNEIRMVNWKQVATLPVLGVEWLPVPVFLAMTFPTNLPAAVADRSKAKRREVFLLGWWKRLYDTHELFGQALVEDVDDPTTWGLWLPSSPEERRVRADARAAAVAAARAAASGEQSTVRRRRNPARPGRSDARTW
jgi:hypothetical protein